MKFGKLTFLEEAGRHANGKLLWRVQCDCGTEAIKRADLVKRGATKSCGCLLVGNVKHGRRNSPEYSSWRRMKERCDRQSNVGFDHYGGRGIRYCAEWAVFESFFRDMGERPSGRTLERNDVNGDYDRGNCRWATPAEQGINKRNNRRISFNGENLTLSQWAARIGLSHQALAYRLDAGMPLEIALGSNLRLQRLENRP
jgi:hypothetical protein